MTSPAGRLLTVEHYRAQVSLRAQAVRDASRIWRMWTPGNTASWRAMVEQAKPVLDLRHQQSSAIAARYFQQLGAVEAGRLARPERPVLAAPLPPEQIEKSLAATGLVGTYTAKARGKSLEAAAQVGFARFQGSFSRLILDGGRATIVASVAASRAASGWTRVTSSDPCSFCADLAGDPSTPEAFQAHDNCSCTAEPAFG